MHVTQATAKMTTHCVATGHGGDVGSSLCKDQDNASEKVAWTIVENLCRSSLCSLCSCNPARGDRVLGNTRRRWTRRSSNPWVLTRVCVSGVWDSRCGVCAVPLGHVCLKITFSICFLYLCALHLFIATSVFLGLVTYITIFPICYCCAWIAYFSSRCLLYSSFNLINLSSKHSTYWTSNPFFFSSASVLFSLQMNPHHQLCLIFLFFPYRYQMPLRDTISFLFVWS